jgi:hypothetical protein
MLLDIGFGRLDRVSLNPLSAKPLGAGERFDLELEAFRRTEQFSSEQRAIYNEYERQIERIAEISGQRVSNPLAVRPGRNTGSKSVLTREKALANYEALVGTLQQEYPDAGILRPEQIQQKILADAKAIRTELDERSAVDVGLGADVAGFFGAAAGAMTDPVNVATLPLGGAARMSGGLAVRMLKQFAVEGAIGAGTQGAIELGNADFKSRAGIEGNSMFNILAAGLGAGVLGMVGRGAVDGYRLFRGEGLTLDELDAVRVADRALHDAETNPHGFQNQRVHEANIDQAEMDLAEGRPTVARQPEPVVQRQDPDAAVAQVAGQVFTPTGRAIDTELQVVEGAGLITSNTQDMTINPIYPQELQPRDRTRAAGETQVQDIAANLEPGRLGASSEAGNGAPIVGPDGVVESGNGRTLAIMRAHGEGGAKSTAYREYLKSQGFNVDNMKNPVLIRRRTTQLTPEERVAFTREANASSTLSMSAMEQALADAGAVRRIIDLYEGGDVSLAQNQKFVNAFIKGLPKNDQGAMTLKEGGLSMQGIRRIEGAVLAAAYGDEAPTLIGKLLESTNNDIKAIGGALQDVAARWSGMRKRAGSGEIAPHMDVTADLINAVRIVEKSRAEKMKMADLMAQGEMFNEGLTDTTKALLVSFYRDGNYQRAAGRKSIADRLIGYLDEAEKTQPGADIFGDAPASAIDVLRATDPRKAQLNLVADKARVSEQVMDDVLSDDAAFTEAQRLAASQNPDVNTPDGVKKAADLLDEAEDEIRVADEIANACVAGKEPQE